MGPVDMDPEQLLIFHEACSESRYTDPPRFERNNPRKHESQNSVSKICQSQVRSSLPSVFFSQEDHHLFGNDCCCMLRE